MKTLKVIITLLTTLSTFAAIGNFSMIKGEVLLFSKSKSRLVKIKESFELNDIIETKKNAIAVVKLTDGSIIKINSESKISVQEIYTKNNKTSVFLDSGSAFFNISKNIAPNITRPSKETLKEASLEKFSVKTRTASLGVRGTIFFTAFNTNDKSGENDTWMCVKEGLVSVTSVITKDQKLVRENEGLKISSEDKLDDPRFLPWTSGLNWEFDSEKDIENKLDIKEAYEDILTNDYD